MSLSLSLSFSLSVSLSLISLSLSLSLYLSFSFTLSVSFCLSHLVCLSLTLSVLLCLGHPVCLTLSVSLLSACLLGYLSCLCPSSLCEPKIDSCILHILPLSLSVCFLVFLCLSLSSLFYFFVYVSCVSRSFPLSLLVPTTGRHNRQTEREGSLKRRGRATQRETEIELSLGEAMKVLLIQLPKPLLF